MIIQSFYITHFVQDCGADYPYNVDVTNMFYEWENHKHEDILSYRDKSFPSKFTGKEEKNLLR